MSLESVFGVGQSALTAQTYRLNVIAENLANAEVAAGSPEEAYKEQYPVFKSVFSEIDGSMAMKVAVDGTVSDERAPRSSYEPGNPIADANGFVYKSNVNSVQEMASMMEASRSYQTNIEVMNTAKDLLMRTLTIGQQ